MKAAPRPEAGVELDREDESVDDRDASRVIANQERRPVLRDVPDPAHLWSEVGSEHPPPQRQSAANVLGVPLVEVVSMGETLGDAGQVVERPTADLADSGEHFRGIIEEAVDSLAVGHLPTC